MIKTILFDMGQVLLIFDRQLFLNRLELSEADKKLLLEEVFLSVEWVQMDRGTLDEPEAEAIMRERLPERLHEAVHALVSLWDEPILPMPGMYELVKELKDKGYGLYLLSNASHRQHEYWPRLPVSQLFEGTLISADEGVMKPHPEIYRLILERFHLKAEECFFVDDAPANVEGARHLGIPAAVFHGDAKRLRRELRAAGINVEE